MTDSAEMLVRAMWREVEARSDIVTGRHIPVPPILLSDVHVSEARYGRTFPVLAHLDDALELARNYELRGLADGIAVQRDSLNWSQNPTYTEKNCSRAFLDGYAYAGLSGPDGPVYWSAPRTGVMLMGPHVLYPGHNHAPREIYMLLTPGTQWRLNGGAWFDVEAGSLIFHDSWQMHEMRTGNHPMLAVAAWTEPGDRGSIAFDAARMGATR